MHRLSISNNRRFLIDEDGSPFFWLGDTAWELFHRLRLEEAEFYLENRRQKGFSVIQAVALAELDGLNSPNVYGQCPLLHNDPLSPNEKYFQYIDQVINLAASKGMYMGLLPTWGDKIELLGHGKGPVIFNPTNAFQYGQWIGKRYRDVWNIIWINGGDRSGGGANYPVWDALGKGIKSVDPHHLMTFHPLGGGDGHSSSEWFHHAEWLDFNLAQSGHERKGLPNYEIISRDYGMSPSKPCLDGEPRYEDHAVNWKPQELGWFDDCDVRQAAYWAVFSGAFGHTYGCHPLWQFFEPGREPISFARRSWREALDLPGAGQMSHLKALLLSRPFFSRVPDQTLLSPECRTSTPYIVATRDQEGHYALIYLPIGGKVRIDLSKLDGDRIIAWWYNPRRGSIWSGPHSTGLQTDGQRRDALLIERSSNGGGMREFTAPGAGPDQDWVLVLDNAAMQFPPPGVLLSDNPPRP